MLVRRREEMVERRIVAERAAPFLEVPPELVAYVRASRGRENASRMRSRQLRAFIAVISAIAVAGLAYGFWSQRQRLSAYARVLTENIWPKVLSAAAEKALATVVKNGKSGSFETIFRETLAALSK